MDETRKRAIDEQIKGRLESAKGKIKETVGDLTGDEETREEGQADQAEGKLRDTAGRAVRDVKDAADRLKDKLTGKD